MEMALATRPKYIFHCASKDTRSIEPLRLQETLFDQEYQKKFKHLGIENKPLTLAFSNFDRALSHAFSQNIDDILLRSTARINKLPIEIVIVSKSSLADSSTREFLIYRVPAKFFIPLKSKEWITDKKIDTEKCAPAYQVRRAEDIMQGVQVFSIDMSAIDSQKERITDFFASRNVKERLLSYLAHLTNEGLLIWENDAKNIDPNPALGTVLKTEGVKASKRLGTNLPQWLRNMSQQPRK